MPTDLVGQQYATAEAELTSDGFTNITKATTPSTKPVNQVLSTTPIGGTAMKPDAKLVVTVSPGPPQVGVPNEQGQLQATALADLKAKGFQYKVVPQPSNTVATNTVISQNPQAGSTATQGSTVTLNVSTGPQMVAVPKVAATDPVSAADALFAAQLVPKEQSEASTSVPIGQVIGTSPSAGTSVKLGSTVLVFVSTGPNQETVPNINGETLQQAEAQLSVLGLKYTVNMQAVSTPAQNNTVITSSPIQGSTAAQGSTVVLVVGQYTAPTTTSTTTQTTTSTTTSTPTSSTTSSTTTTSAP